MPDLNMNKMESENEFYGARRMAQQLRTSVVFMYDLGSVPRIHRVAHKIYNSSSRDLCGNQSCT